jgi:hypothetical protein
MTEAQPSLSQLQALGQMLLYLLLLLLVFVLGSWAIMRGSRRFLGNILRRPAEPTPTSDVWSMHRLPDENLDDDDDVQDSESSVDPNEDRDPDE